MKNIFSKKSNKEKEVKKQKKEFAGISLDETTVFNSDNSLSEENLQAVVISDDTKKIMENFKDEGSKAILRLNRGEFIDDITIKFIEGLDNAVIKNLKEHISQEYGKVDKKIWYMLLDSLNIKEDKVDFNKIALKYASIFNCSPPMYFAEEEEDLNMMPDIMIVKELDDSSRAKFKEFVKEVKKNKYCRIDLSKFDADNSTVEGLKQFLNFMKDLKKNNVVSVLLQDDIMTKLCSAYMVREGKVNPTKLRDDFKAEEKLFWLIYLEIMQWKNRMEEFEEVALEYAMSFEESPPGWEESKIMRIEGSINDKNINKDEDVPVFDKEIQNNNIYKITTYINSKKYADVIDLNFSKVHRIDFTGATTFIDFLKEFKVDSPQSKVLISEPNQYIINLLNMLDVNDYAVIKERKR